MASNAPALAVGAFFAWPGPTFVQNRRPRMKSLTRTIFAAAAVCAAISLSPSPAQGTEENFFQKFHPSEPINWSGFYIGFNNGASFNHIHVGKDMTDLDLEEQYYDLVGVTGDGDVNFTTFETPGHHHNDTETIGGAQTGFRFQFGHFVVGAEGSFIGNGTENQSQSQEFQENNIFLETIRSNVIAETEFHSMQKVETTWNGFVGGNVGFAWNRFLFYGEGGAAFTDVHFESKKTADTSFFQTCVEVCDGATPTTVGRVPRQPEGSMFIGEIVSRKTHTQGNVLTGWYGGGGVDFALTNLVSVGVEYKHIEWGNVTEHQMVGSNGGPVFPGNRHVNLDADQVVFKVNLLVGPLGH
jgi:opacity protein-like surface antigen